jgi:hypothetical protein
VIGIEHVLGSLLTLALVAVALALAAVSTMGLIRRGRFVPWLIELLVIFVGAMFALAWLRAALPWAFAP